jgi:Escherichia/Staphylococcus phage prohead protease
MFVNGETEIRSSFDFGETRGVSSEGRRLSGYAIVFNTRSIDLGGFYEVIHPEAVNRTLRSGDDVMAFVQHDPKKVIGRRKAGTLQLRSDSRGLHADIDPIPNTSDGRDLIENISLGNISGMSFAFRVMPDGDSLQYEGGTLIRHVTDILIREVSVVTGPCYPDTSVALRSIYELQHGKHSRKFWEDQHRSRLAR